MPGVPNSPLNDSHLNAINAALRNAEQAQTQLLLAKQAGIDVAHHESDLTQAVQKLRQIKNTYFPGSI